MNFVCIVFNLEKEELKCYTQESCLGKKLELLKSWKRKMR